MKSFKQVITEMAKSACEKKFQDYVFGEFNKMGELDTKEEERIFKTIWEFAYSSTPAHKKKVIPALQILKGCKEHYKEILKPKKSILYRGIGVSPKIAKTINFDTSVDKYWSGEYIYKARSKVQSWSETWKIATKFAKLEYEYDYSDVAIMLEVKLDDSFIFTGDFMNKISRKHGYGNQNEVMRVGDAPIKAKVYIEKSHYNHWKDKIE